MKKLLFCLALLGLVACHENKPANNPDQQPQDEQYVDLELPSGSQWASTVAVKTDDPLNLFSADEARAQFDGRIPTKEQWMELLESSYQKVTGEGIELSFRKKSSYRPVRRAPWEDDGAEDAEEADDDWIKILLPYAGYVDCEGANQEQDIAAYLWTSTIDEQTKTMMYLVYSASGYHFTVGEVCDYISMSVLPVEDNTVEVELPPYPEVEGEYPTWEKLLGIWEVDGEMPDALKALYTRENNDLLWHVNPDYFVNEGGLFVTHHDYVTITGREGSYRYCLYNPLNGHLRVALYYLELTEDDEIYSVVTRGPGKDQVSVNYYKPGTDKVATVVFKKVDDVKPILEYPEEILFHSYWQIKGDIPAGLQHLYDIPNSDMLVWDFDRVDKTISIGFPRQEPELGYGSYTYDENTGHFSMEYENAYSGGIQDAVLTTEYAGGYNKVTLSYTKPGSEEPIIVRFEWIRYWDAPAPPESVEPDDPNFVDLGLPSGTKWKIENEVDLSRHNCFNLAEMQEMVSQVPTESQWRELQKECTWKWNFEQNGFDVRSKINGNTIFLPAAGFYNNRGTLVEEEIEGTYWSSTPGANNQYVFQWFNPANISLLSSVPTSYSIRLVDAARDVEVSSGTVDHNLHPDERSLIYYPLIIVGAVPDEFKAAQVFGGSDEVKLGMGYYNGGEASIRIGSTEALEQIENAWTYNETTSLLHLKCYDVLDISGLVFNGPEENQYAFMYKRGDEPVVVIFEKISGWDPSMIYWRLPTATYLLGTWSFTGDIARNPSVGRHQRNGCKVYFDGNSRVVIGNGNYWGEGTYSYDQATYIINASVSDCSFYITDMHVYMESKLNSAIKFLDMSEDEEPWVFKMERQSWKDVVPEVEE